MKVSRVLMSLTNYPIPMPIIENIMDGEGLDIDTEIDKSVRQSAAFKRCQAKIYFFLASAPNVSQGGISYSFSQSEREYFTRAANHILNNLNDTQDTTEVEVGYIGEDF